MKDRRYSIVTRWIAGYPKKQHIALFNNTEIGNGDTRWDAEQIIRQHKAPAKQAA